MGNEKAGERAGAGGARLCSLLSPARFLFLSIPNGGSKCCPHFFLFRTGRSTCCPRCFLFRTRGQRVLPPFLLISNGGSECCPHFVSIAGSVYPTRCPYSFPFRTGAAVFTPPLFLSNSNRGGDIPAAPVSFVLNGRGVSPTHRPHFFTPNDGGISFRSN